MLGKEILDFSKVRYIALIMSQRFTRRPRRAPSSRIPRGRSFRFAEAATRQVGRWVRLDGDRRRRTGLLLRSRAARPGGGFRQICLVRRSLHDAVANFRRRCARKSARLDLHVDGAAASTMWASRRRLLVVRLLARPCARDVRVLRRTVKDLLTTVPSSSSC